MKNVFKFVAVVCIITSIIFGVMVITSFICSIIQICGYNPPLFNSIDAVFGTIGSINTPIAFLTLPTILANIIVRMFEDEKGNNAESILITCIMLTLLFVLPATVMIYNDHPGTAVVLLVVWIASFIIGKGGHSYTVPFFEKV